MLATRNVPSAVDEEPNCVSARMRRAGDVPTSPYAEEAL